MKLSAILTILFVLGACLQAEVPPTLNYQGRVLQNGQPFDGTGHFVFGIYEGSTLLWTNKLPVPSPLNDPASGIDSSDAKALTVRNGVFTIRLGEGDAKNAPVGTDIFFKLDGTQRVRTDVKLAVWFSPTAEGPYTRLDPDITFASVPFAQVAGVAVNVMNGAVTTQSLGEGAAVGNIGTGGILISREQLSPALVGASQIEEGSIGPGKIMAGQGLVPAGSILPFGGEVIPEGWLLCDGSALDKDADGGRLLHLHAAILTAWGDGSTGPGAVPGTTDFNLPDLRGTFIRGVAHGSSNDPDRVSRQALAAGGNSGDMVGSTQQDDFKSHRHEHKARGGGGGSFNPTGTVTGDANIFNFTPSEYSGGNETRPKNAYVNYIIKY